MLEDLSDPTRFTRKMRKDIKRTPVRTGIQTEFITRTAYDALLAASATSNQVLYAIDESA